MTDEIETFEHRGFFGSIHYSPDDNVMFGKILFIHALVNYEGYTIESLKSAFVDAVDDFIATSDIDSVATYKSLSAIAMGTL